MSALARKTPIQHCKWIQRMEEIGACLSFISIGHKREDVAQKLQRQAFQSQMRRLRWQQMSPPQPLNYWHLQQHLNRLQCTIYICVLLVAAAAARLHACLQATNACAQATRIYLTWPDFDSICTGTRRSSPAMYRSCFDRICFRSTRGASVALISSEANGGLQLTKLVCVMMRRVQLAEMNATVECDRMVQKEQQMATDVDVDVLCLRQDPPRSCQSQTRR